LDSGRTPRVQLSSVKVPALAATIATLLVIAALGAVALANWPAADDYCIHVWVVEKGILGALRWHYAEWGGRLVPLAVLYAASAWLDLANLRWLSLACVGVLAVAAWLLASLIAMSQRELRLPLWALLMSAVAVGVYGLLGQVVFWPTGGVVYMLPLLFASLLLLDTRRLLHGAAPRDVDATRGFAVGFLAGNAIELTAPILAAYAALSIPARWRELSPVVRRSLGWRLGGLAAGMLVLAAAPGNYQRASVTPDAFRLDAGFLASQYVSMLKQIATATWPMVAIIAAAAVASIVAVGGAPRRPRGVQALSAARESVALAVGSLASMLPVLAAPPQFAHRNGLYLLVFLLVAALLPLVAVARNEAARRVLPMTFALLALAGAVVALAQLVPDAGLARAIRDRQVERDARLRDVARSRDQDATVARIGLRVPDTLHYVDVGTDREQWNNVCTAKYYGLRSIALDPAM
jgi:hypothetical protein